MNEMPKAFHAHMIGSHTCPLCSHPLNIAGNEEGNKPIPLVPILCAYCLGYLFFDERHTLRPVTRDMLATHPADILRELDELKESLRNSPLRHNGDAHDDGGR
jgi:hypothetical protein